MARKAAVKDDPLAIGGARLNPGEIVLWTPQDDKGSTCSESSYCSNIDDWTTDLNDGCRIPQTVVVLETDFNDETTPYYVKTSKCCGSCDESVWVHPAELTRVETSKALTDLRDLVNKINNDAITIKELKKVCGEILAAFTLREQQSDTKAKGVCSACFTDVEFVGGSWQHADKRICNSPAVLLA